MASASTADWCGISPGLVFTPLRETWLSPLDLPLRLVWGGPVC